MIVSTGLISPEDPSQLKSRRWWCSPGGVGVVDTRWRWPHGYQTVSDRYRQTVAISAMWRYIRLLENFRSKPLKNNSIYFHCDLILFPTDLKFLICKIKDPLL